MFIDLKIKKYYVFGEANRNLPVIRLLESVPKIQISKSGHFMMIDNPEEFYQKLSNLLSQ
jgi:pimeloyl-ACP methyl ester carboxylesterase